MKIQEALPKARDNGPSFGFKSQNAEDFGIHIRGDVFVQLQDTQSGETEKHEFRNIVVYDASILLARLLKDNQEPAHGAYCLAVGTGDDGWNPMSPPAATKPQRALYSEITRKTFSSTAFIDHLGAEVSYPTKVIDFTTTFSESEAVGPLVEMGLIGGNVSSNMSVRSPMAPPNGTYDPTEDFNTPSRETLINYLTFATINKPATSTMTITWRLSL